MASAATSTSYVGTQRNGVNRKQAAQSTKVALHGEVYVPVWAWCTSPMCGLLKSTSGATAWVAVVSMVCFLTGYHCSLLMNEGSLST